MNILSTVLVWILFSSFMACLLTIVIVIVKKIFKKNVTIRFYEFLWILIIIRLIIPVTVQSPLNLLNFLPQIEEEEKSKEKSTIPNIATDFLRENQLYWNSTKNNISIHDTVKDQITQQSNYLEINKKGEIQKKIIQNILKILSVAWFLGFIIGFCRIVIFTIGFRMKIKRFKRMVLNLKNWHY